MYWKFESQFPPSTTWILGMGCRWLALVASIPIGLAVMLAKKCILPSTSELPFCPGFEDSRFLTTEGLRALTLTLKSLLINCGAKFEHLGALVPLVLHCLEASGGRSTSYTVLSWVGRWLSTVAISSVLCVILEGLGVPNLP